MGGGGGGNTTTTTKSDPWSGAQPYLTDVMSQAQTVYNNSANNQYYPGLSVAPFSPTTNQAMNMVTDRANSGSGALASANKNIGGIMDGTNLQQRALEHLASGVGLYNDDAMGYLTDATRGRYLDATQNPAFQTMLGDVTNQVNAQFGAAGRTGSGMQGQTLARGLSQGASGLYDAERNRQQSAAGALQGYTQSGAQNQQSAANSYINNQLQAMGLSPQLAAADYLDSSALMGIGQMQDDLGARTIQDQMDRYNYAQNLPLTNLQNYSSIINGYGGLGGQSSTTEPGAKSNKLGGAVGGALAGAQIGGPWGAAAGGLLGLFS